MSQAELSVPELTRDDRLRGRTVLVTGGGARGAIAGTGAAISVLLAAKGARIVIVDHDADRAETTGRAVTSVGGESIVVTADITAQGDCARAVASAVAAYGGVDVLVNNAGIAPKEQPEPGYETWHRVLALDLTAAKMMIDAALPSMRARGRGSIVNIASVAGLEAGGGAAYSSAKAGLIGLTRVVALQEGRAGIRVNAIAPGHLMTPMGLHSTAMPHLGPDLARDRRAQANMLGVEGHAWDVAYAALFLAGDESRYITAVTLPVDGGTTAAMPLAIWHHISAPG
ncbi:MAG TPA: SDR family oxidoreductase [Amycolatopsis sp.]|nr:SDR family oxidoreductase [Amycolatopsis sp.]